MKYLILGGTGTLGTGLTREILKDPKASVTCFSRCELKQKEVQNQFNDDRLSFVLGDIRDYRSLESAMKRMDAVFHVAALKHIDILESNPDECVKTNILGTMNVADAAISAGVPYCVFSSTDKAVDPINVYGMCKGVSEKILFNRNETQFKTYFSVFRWGNVIGSRGSVIHSFIDSLLKDRSVRITDEQMTRFWIDIDTAIQFMLQKYPNAERFKAMIPPIKAAPVMMVVEGIAELMQITNYRHKVVGLRRGEKMHEALTSLHDENQLESRTAARFSKAELRQVLYPIVSSYLNKRLASNERVPFQTLEASK